MNVATGIPALDAALVWGGAITALAGIGTVAWRGVRGVLHLGRRVNEFMDDWAGEEARPGVPARPRGWSRWASSGVPGACRA